MAWNNEQELSVYGRETVQLLPTLPDKRRINDDNSDQTACYPLEEIQNSHRLSHRRERVFFLSYAFQFAFQRIEIYASKTHE